MNVKRKITKTEKPSGHSTYSEELKQLYRDKLEYLKTEERPSSASRKDQLDYLKGPDKGASLDERICFFLLLLQASLVEENVLLFLGLP